MAARVIRPKQTLIVGRSVRGCAEPIISALERLGECDGSELRQAVQAQSTTPSHAILGKAMELREPLRVFLQTRNQAPIADEFNRRLLAIRDKLMTWEHEAFGDPPPKYRNDGTTNEFSEYLCERYDALCDEAQALADYLRRLVLSIEPPETKPGSAGPNDSARLDLRRRTLSAIERWRPIVEGLENFYKAIKDFDQLDGVDALGELPSLNIESACAYVADLGFQGFASDANEVQKLTAFIANEYGIILGNLKPLAGHPEYAAQRLQILKLKARNAADVSRHLLKNLEGTVEANTPAASDPAEGTTKPEGEATANKATKQKRSTNRGDAQIKLKAAFLAYHQYQSSNNGSCGKFDPINANDLARDAGILKDGLRSGSSSASRFFGKWFGDDEGKNGYARYRALCANPSQQPLFVAQCRAMAGDPLPRQLVTVGGDPSVPEFDDDK